VSYSFGVVGGEGDYLVANTVHDVIIPNSSRRNIRI
jgi:hypothetical protein